MVISGLFLSDMPLTSQFLDVNSLNAVLDDNKINPPQNAKLQFLLTDTQFFTIHVLIRIGLDRSRPAVVQSCHASARSFHRYLCWLKYY